MHFQTRINSILLGSWSGRRVVPQHEKLLSRRYSGGEDGIHLDFFRFTSLTIPKAHAPDATLDTRRFLS